MRKAVSLLFVAMSVSALFWTGPPIAAREWNSADGQFSIQAEFVSADETSVALKKDEDGTLINVPLAMLSEADQAHIRTLATEPDTADAPDPPASSGPATDTPPTEPATPATLHWELESATIPAQAFRTPIGFSYGISVEMDRAADTAFRNAVKVEPEEYPSNYLFHGTLEHVDQTFGFVVVVMWGGSPMSPRLNALLLFDTDGDGDLTNETPIQGERSGSMAPFTFPLIEIQTTIDGEPYPCALRASVVISFVRGETIALPDNLTMIFKPASFRQGTIRLGRQTLSVALIDANANGRFDDTVPDETSDNWTTVSNTDLDPTGEARSMTGIQEQSVQAALHAADRLILRDGDERLSSDPPGSFPGLALSKCMPFNGVCYSVTVNPSGSSLTLEPIAAEMGAVLGSDNGGRSGAVLTGAAYHPDYGAVELKRCDDETPLTLPVGEYVFLGGTASIGDGTSIELDAFPQTETFEVKPGETTVLPYGPPFHGQANAARIRADAPLDLLQAGQSTTFSVLYIGAGGCYCPFDKVRIPGAAPPEILIKNPDGRPVHLGRFTFTIDGLGTYLWEAPNEPIPHYDVYINLDVGAFAQENTVPTKMTVEE